VIPRQNPRRLLPFPSVGRLSFWPIGLALVFCAVVGQRTTAWTSQSAAPPPQNGPAKTTQAGVYSSVQAAKGEEVYFNVCVACHPPGTYKGGIFKTNWEGKPLSELFDSVSEKMPKNEPGSLPLEQYAQVIAYMLKVNDMPAGKTDMPSDSTLLKDIRIEFGK
jgi:mono/diheme cytochrome c family protein